MSKVKQQEPVFNVYRSRKQLMVDNLLGGISWGVGSVIGATVVITLLGFTIAQLQTVPFLGDVVNVIIKEVTEYSTSF